MAKSQDQEPSIGSCDIYVVKLRNINSQAVSDAIRTIHSLNAPRQAIALTDQTGRRGRVAQTAPPPAAELEEPGLFVEALDDIEDQSPPMEPENLQGGEATGARRRRGDGPKQDRNAGIAAVPNLNFIPSGKPALKLFFAEKAPGSDMDRVLVLSYYLQHTMGLAVHGPGHILAGFRHVEVELPKDLPATIRNMKRKVWLNFSDIGSITVATEGINRVEHALPKDKTSAA